MQKHHLPYKLLLTLFILLISTISQAQNGRHKLNLDLKNQSIRQAFQEIEQQTSLKFSFDSKLIKQDILITYRANNKSLKKIFNELFNKKVAHKVIGNHIVLFRRIKNKRIKRKEQKEKSIKQGFVSIKLLNAITKLPLDRAVVYQISTGVSYQSGVNGMVFLPLHSNPYKQLYNIESPPKRAFLNLS